MRARPEELDARTRILHAAGQIFAAVGYDGARVDEIAARAGVNKAMLYYYVGDKERLYAAILTETIDRAYARLTEAVAKSPTPSAKIQSVLDTLASIGTETPTFIPLVMREIASGGAHLPDEMILRMSNVFRIVAGVLGEGMERGAFRRMDPLLTHVSVIGSMMFLIASAPVRRRVAKIAGVASGEQTPAELARHVGKLMLHGLEVPARRKRPARRRS